MKSIPRCVGRVVGIKILMSLVVGLFATLFFVGCAKSLNDANSNVSIRDLNIEVATVIPGTTDTIPVLDSIPLGATLVIKVTYKGSTDSTAVWVRDSLQSYYFTYSDSNTTSSTGATGAPIGIHKYTSGGKKIITVYLTYKAPSYATKVITKNIYVKALSAAGTGQDSLLILPDSFPRVASGADSFIVVMKFRVLSFVPDGSKIDSAFISNPKPAIIGLNNDWAHPCSLKNVPKTADGRFYIVTDTLKHGAVQIELFKNWPSRCLYATEQSGSQYFDVGTGNLKYIIGYNGQKYLITTVPADTGRSVFAATDTGDYGDVGVNWRVRFRDKGNDTLYIFCNKINADSSYIVFPATGGRISYSKISTKVDGYNVGLAKIAVASLPADGLAFDYACVADKSLSSFWSPAKKAFWAIWKSSVAKTKNGTIAGHFSPGN